jgi:FkbH-like protein
MKSVPLKSLLMRLGLLRQAFSNDIVHELMATYPKSPSSLKLTTPLYDVLVLGSCNTDSLIAGLSPDLINADQLLWNSRSEADIPEVGKMTKTYDAVYVQLTLRHILESVHTGERGSLSWIDQDNLEKYQIESKSIILGICDRMREQNKDQTLIFGSFFTPTVSLEGPLRSINELAPINNFIPELNLALNEWCDNHNSYFIDVNMIANWIGRRHVVDDTVNGMLHNSTIGDDIYGDLTTRFTESLGISAQYDAWPRNIEYGKLLADKILEIIKFDKKDHPIKLIILDIDETLWRGIHAEDDFNNLARTEGWPLGFIEALLLYKQKGGLLALCSKNEEDTTLQSFHSIWGLHVLIDDFASFRINYNHKANNVAEILEETCILPQNVLYVDDNPREIENVRIEFPEMIFMNTEHYDWRRSILSHSNFFMNSSTIESKNRTHLIQSRIKRVSLMEGMRSKEEWLQNLQLKSVGQKLIESEGAHFDRVLELLNKTNQFNLNGKKFSVKDLTYIVSKFDVFYFTLSDRLADNGIISVVIVNGKVIENFVLSCRVFGLSFEYELINYLSKKLNISINELEFSYVPTERNLAVKNFLETYKDLDPEARFIDFNFRE